MTDKLHDVGVWINRYMADHLKCKCGKSLVNRNVQCYAHPDGWQVPGWNGRWWLYIVCPVCYYQMSFAKLGIYDDGTFMKMPSEVCEQPVAAHEA